ncbi:MAG TPA: hypothetical protein VII94_04475 [Candidatus Saccharimonadales bacterium]
MVDNNYPIVPNYVPGIGRLVTDRYDFEAHILGVPSPQGFDFRHQANQIDVIPNLTIDGYTSSNVQATLTTIASILNNEHIPFATGSTPGLIELSGDIATTLWSTSTYDNITVGKIQGYPITILSNPINGNVLAWNGTAWVPTALTFSAYGGDLSGTPNSQNVIGIRGVSVSATSPTDGQTLIYNGGTLQWTPAAPSITLSGDVTGLSSATAVVNVNGASVPAAGSLTTGNTLYVSGSSALSYGALNLAGGAGYVTGSLPAGNQAAQNMGGDISGTTASSVINRIDGYLTGFGESGTLMRINAATTLQWTNAIISPIFNQEQAVIGSGNGNNLTISAQRGANGRSSPFALPGAGGNLLLGGGIGGTINGTGATGFIQCNTGISFSNINLRGGVTYTCDTGNFSDCLIFVGTSYGATTIILPASNTAGRIIIVKDADGVASTHNITVETSGSSIDGTATKVINTNNGSSRFACSAGGDWYII